VGISLFVSGCATTGGLLALPFQLVGKILSLSMGISKQALQIAGPLALKYFTAGIL